MIVAAGSVHWHHGLFAASNGIEVPLLYGAAGAALALTGPGQYSLDGLIGLTEVWTPAVAWTVLALSVLGGFANLAIRRPAPAAATA
jgi:putative oxidoreductase